MKDLEKLYAIIAEQNRRDAEHYAAIVEDLLYEHIKRFNEQLRKPHEEKVSGRPGRSV